MTSIEPFEIFYPAENYHQDYYELNPNNSYCSYVISPKVEKFKKVFSDILKNLYDEKEIFLTELINNNGFSIINIWASWCMPCRSEHNYLLKLKNIYQIDIIGINYKDKKSNAVKFLSDLGNPYLNILVDKDGTKSIELGAIGVPETYLINNKVMIKKYIGPLNDETFKEIIEIIKNEKN